MEYPALPIGVVNIAFLVDGHKLAFVQPLPVMSSEAVAEMQQVWASMALAAAAQRSHSAADCAGPSSAPGCSSSEIQEDLSADGQPGTSADLSAAVAGLLPQHSYAAWQTHLAPLLVDVAYIMAADKDTQPDGYQSAVQHVMQHVMKYMASNGMWHNIQFVADLTAGGITAAAPGGDAAASTADEPHEQHLSISEAWGCMQTAVAARWSAVKSDMQGGFAVITRLCLIWSMMMMGLIQTIKSLVWGPSKPNGSQGRGQPAANHDVGASAWQQMMWVLRGFKQPGMERKYLAYKQDRTITSDMFILLWHGACALLMVSSYTAGTTQYTQRILIGKFVILMAHFILPAMFIIIRPKLAPGARDTAVTAYVVVLILAGVSLVMDLWDMPAVLTRCLSGGGLSNDLAVIGSLGFIRPFSHQVSRCQGQGHQRLLIVATRLYCAHCLCIALCPACAFVL